MAAKRLTKREMKEDKIAEAFLKVWAEAQKNVGALIAGAVVVVVVIVGAATFTRGKAKAEEDASVALLQAKAEMWRNNPSGATPVFEMVLQRYGGTSAAKESRLYLGTLAFVQGKVDEAQSNYEKFLKSGSKDDLLIQGALEGSAACYEAKGDYGQAAKRYEEIAGKYPKDNLVAPRNFLAAGRCYEAMGKYTEARAVYQQAVKEYPESPLKTQAQSSLAMLFGR